MKACFHIVRVPSEKAWFFLKPCARRNMLLNNFNSVELSNNANHRMSHYSTQNRHLRQSQPVRLPPFPLNLLPTAFAIHLLLHRSRVSLAFPVALCLWKYQYRSFQEEVSVGKSAL